MRRRVAVLGGGLAGLTAAYELAQRDDVEVTVYQMGWRLGGKVASSRNAALGMRIEEHGIHVLFGAYENAFHVLRRVYTELGLDWKQAFVERSEFTLMEDGEDGPGTWTPWIVGLPREDGDPGDVLAAGGDGGEAAPHLTVQLLQWLRQHLLSYFAGSRLEGPARWFFGGSLGYAERRAAVIRGAARPERYPESEARWLLWHLRWNLFLLRIAAWIGQIVWFVLRGFASPTLRRSVRRFWVAAELGISAAAGLTRAALDDSIRTLDDGDFRDWLSRHGVLGTGITRTTSRSAPLRMVYEVVFAYEGGDPRRPALAAGTAVRALLRLLFDRRGALAYVMAAGSAETMITPLYQALVRRGVRFEFFSRVDRLELSADRRRVEYVHLTRQAEPKGEAYDPLLAGGGWPTHPRYELLVDGDALAAAERESGQDLEAADFTPPGARCEMLTCGGSGSRGFDDVVLAIPGGALGTACAELAAHDPLWQDMLANVRTTATQSVQLWLDATAADLGWQPPGGSEPALLGGYAQPFGNWADLSVTLTHERWPEGATPGSVAYLCGPLDEKTVGLLRNRAETGALVQDTCRAWLERYGSAYWASAFGGGIDGRLVAPGAAPGAAYAAQFFRANTRAWERYTLSLPGTMKHRLAPDDSGFDNLVIAGDWTSNGFDVGCVEATVMAGRLAARHVLGLETSEMPVYGEFQLPRRHPSGVPTDRAGKHFLRTGRS